MVLLLGLGFASQGSEARMQPGVALCSRQLLRIGVALLGARIGVAQLEAVGARPLLLVLVTVPLVPSVPVTVTPACEDRVTAPPLPPAPPAGSCWTKAVCGAMGPRRISPV